MDWSDLDFHLKVFSHWGYVPELELVPERVASMNDCIEQRQRIVYMSCICPGIREVTVIRDSLYPHHESAPKRHLDRFQPFLHSTSM